MHKIVTLTMNPAIDKSAEVETVASEIKMRCEKPRFEAGGGGINVSRAIQKLGGKSLAIYPAGGHTGQILEEILESEGIAQHVVPAQNNTRENLTVFETSTTLQYRFGMPGAELSEGEWQQCLDVVMDLEADYLVASGSLPESVPIDFYAQIAKIGKQKNIRVIVDTSGEALKHAVDAGVFLLKPNIRELEIFTNQKILGEEHLRKVGQNMIAQGKTEVILVSMGAGGAALITADTFAMLRAPLVPIQSKVGAGDSMVGGIVLALAGNASIQQAAMSGVAAGTAAVMTPGTQLCRREDFEMILPRVTID